jgi:hypothetical protein
LPRQEEKEREHRQGPERAQEVLCHDRGAQAGVGDEERTPARALIRRDKARKRQHDEEHEQEIRFGEPPE